MDKILTIVFSAIFVLFVSFESVSGQTDDDLQDYIKGERRWLRGDLKAADVAAYVDVRDVKFAASTGREADCENNQGSGYCSYLLTAEVKEIYKGKTESKILEFYVGAEAQFQKKHLFGEQIVFLIWSENEKNGKRSLGTIENSTRRTDLLAEMRKIVNSQTAIDDADDSEPYSTPSIQLDFEEADAVVYADATDFKPFTDAFGIEAFMLQAEVKEVFKGEFKAKQTIEYKEDLLHRPVRREDLGKHVLFLKRTEEDGKIFYERIRYTITDIEHNVLEKLRKIARQK